MAAHNDLGKLGEQLAKEYLVQNGYEIVTTTYRYGRAEVDIIAKLGKMLVFIEVKTRSTVTFGFPEDAVTAKKRQFLFDAAAQYMYENQYEDEIRFDIISIIIDKNNKISELKHFDDAFFFL
ncbi:MAG: hypothetical protein RI894_2065 [Bacteroidota bacterium]|jgi:putative endonuclease